MMIRRKEADIKRAIVQYLKCHGHLVIPYRNVGVYKKATGSYIPAARHGVSDLLGITTKGGFFAVEVKRPGGKATREQLEFLNTVRSYGCIGIIACSIDDCIEAGL